MQNLIHESLFPRLPNPTLPKPSEGIRTGWTPPPRDRATGGTSWRLRASVVLGLLCALAFVTITAWTLVWLIRGVGHFAAWCISLFS